MRRRDWGILAVLLVCLLAVGAVRAADEGLRGQWTFDDVQAGKPQCFRVTQKAIDATTVVWQSRVADGQDAATVAKTVADSSGKRNRARAVGSLLIVPGVCGRAIQLDGKIDYLEAADSPSLHVTGAVTIQLWILPDDSENGVLISKDFKAAGPSWCQMYLWGKPRNLNVAVNDDAGPTLVSKSVIEPGRWYHLAMTYDGKGRTRLYVNGKLECENNSRYHGPIPVGEEPLRIGKRADGYPFRGAVDEVVCGRTRTDARADRCPLQNGQPDTSPIDC